MSTEREDLDTHVTICELRYKQLDDRMGKVERQIQEINIDLQDFKTECRQNFHEIKLMLQSAKDDKFKVVVNTAGTIIVALVGALGYMLMHVK
jgi:chromosome segregation ATPase